VKPGSPLTITTARTVLALIVVLLHPSPGPAIERFPPPDFVESNYEMPVIQQTMPRSLVAKYIDVIVLAGVLSLVAKYIDVIVLAGVLSLAAVLVLKRRSRRETLWLSVFSMLYFGFWRQGCVCSIGSIQNISQALFDSSYAIPLTVLAFGVLPLLAALLFGRIFCAAACPHGALQDLVLIKPVQVPPWLDQGLRRFAYGYLGLAVVFAATGGGYVICQYDPFIPIFRLSGSTMMVWIGIGFLLAGTVIGRPYCRYLCPYGVLLGLFSAVSRWRVRITPDSCTQCRLCEKSCPYAAITLPDLETTAPRAPVSRGRLTVMIIVLPVITAAMGALGAWAGKGLALKHRDVALSQRIHLEDSGAARGTTDASDAYRRSGEPANVIHARARTARDQIVLAGLLCGVWIGLTAGIKALRVSVHRPRHDYEADRANCFACARCFDYCPQEHEQLKRLGRPLPAWASANAET